MRRHEKSNLNAKPPCSRRYVTHARLAAVVSAIVIFAAGIGCGRNPAPDGAKPPPGPTDPVRPPPELPEHSFAEGLVSQHPDVVDFLREFVQVCLNGDYLGYRRLVSRYDTPVSRERFEAIYHSIRAVHVESIEPLNARTNEGEPVYLVVSEIEIDPESRIAIRHREPRMAIYVFREDDSWRMRPAPTEAALEQESADDGPQTPSTAPSYPWDVDGDG